MARSLWLLMMCALPLLFGSCVVYQSGVVLDATAVGAIQRNATTRAQVEAMFGPPMDVEILAVNERMLKYWYKQVYDRGQGLFVVNPGTQTRHQMLLVWIGPDNVVKDFEFTDYVTDRTIVGTAEVVRRTAVTTQPGQKPTWFPGGDD